MMCLEKSFNRFRPLIQTYITVSRPLSPVRPYLFHSEHSYRAVSVAVIFLMCKLPVAEMRYLAADG